MTATYLPVSGNGSGFTLTTCSLLPSSAISRSSTAFFVLDMCVFFLLPFGIMVMCNVSILAKVVCLASAKRNTLQARGGQTTPAHNGRSQKMCRTVTRRIVILSLTYCLCNAPLSIYNLILTSDTAGDVVYADHVDIYRIAFHILVYLNNGVNFLLYCMIGSGFRKDFVGMFRSGSRTSTTR